MKKTLLIIAVLFVSVITLRAGDKIYGELGMNLLLPSDSNYKEIYGSSVKMSEIEIGYMVSKNIGIYGGVEYMLKNGISEEELKEEAESRILYFDMGIILRIYKSNKTSIKLKGGISYIMNKEEAMEEEVSSNTLGYRGELEVDYKIVGKLFTGFKVGYIYGKDNVEDVDIKSGGVKIGIIIGLIF